MDLFGQAEASGITQKLVESGLGWVVSIVLAGVVVYLAKALLAEKDKRIEAAEKIREDITEPLRNIQSTSQLIYEKIRISKEASQ